MQTSYIPKPSTLPFESKSYNQVRIAYFIMVHHKPETFKKMFQKIYTRDQFYLIHIDRKAKTEIVEAIQQYIIQYPNAYILESRTIVSGGFNMIRSELDAMEFLLNVNSEWDYFINLSGEDYPLKSQSIIRTFLSVNKHQNYLSYYNQTSYRPDTLQRISNHFTELKHKISSFIYKREFMKDVTPYIGGKWMIITRDTCSFLSNNKRVMDFEEYYLNTLLPAESFFQTVLMNTSFHDIIINDDKRAVIEKKLFNTDENITVFLQYLASNNHLFIRKINDETHQNIVQYIEDSFSLPLPDIHKTTGDFKNKQNN